MSEIPEINDSYIFFLTLTSVTVSVTLKIPTLYLMFLNVNLLSSMKLGENFL